MNYEFKTANTANHQHNPYKYTHKYTVGSETLLEFLIFDAFNSFSNAQDMEFVNKIPLKNACDKKVRWLILNKNCMQHRLKQVSINLSFSL